MKKYTGFEAIERLKTNVIDDGKSIYRYNKEMNLIEFSFKASKLPWQNVIIDISYFFGKEFIDYEEPFEIGDWVACEVNQNKTIGKLIVIDEIEMEYDAAPGELLRVARTEYIRKANAEEIAQEKRRRLFEKHGRAIDGFKNGDVVTPADNDKALLLVEYYNPHKNAVRIGGTYYNASDVNPTYFVESKVALEN
ncbi:MULTISPECIES: hypothetical protein [Bacillus]|uniref:hypothetical protein n=1 Tax=Bacillus TaxID=1386 RepID=UPI000279969F|nr:MULTISPECIES: hypothetical protein [Bacillus]EJS13433.1 hypothetical protein IKS_03512 [Bacillus cereus VDM062]RAN69149.1 hypothetical protein B5P40_17370 [Bacillus sp. SRB_8]WJE66492.1 hypothetical protein QRE63_11570 [Bacillus mycoides]